MNRWNYVEGNPVNYSDPSGKWKWRISSGSVQHDVIESYYEGSKGFTNQNKHIEYTIPGGRKRPDIFNSLTGDVWEIEPIDKIRGKGHGLAQALTYMRILNDAARNNLLDGNYRNGNISFPYNWNDTKFRLGRISDWPGHYRSNLSIFLEFHADYVEDGVIAYWYEPTRLSKILAFSIVTQYSIRKSIIKDRGWMPGTPRKAPSFEYLEDLYDKMYPFQLPGGLIWDISLNGIMENPNICNTINF